MIENYYTELKPNTRQSEVYEILKTLSIAYEHNLQDWYLGAFYALENPYNPDRIVQAVHSLRELLEKLIKCECKVKKVVKSEEKKLVKKLFSNTIPEWEALDEDSREEKCEKFIKLREKLRDSAHHKPLKENELNSMIKEVEDFIIKMRASIAKERIEMERIIQAPKRTDEDIKKLLFLAKRKRSNYAFFFGQIKNAPDWFLKLSQKGLFNESPYSEGRWPPILYLEAIANKKPKEVVETILKLQATNNPSILKTISNIALKIPLEESIKLKDWIFKYLKASYLDPDIINNLIKYWSEKDIHKINIGLALIKEVVFFEPDPRLEEKLQARKSNLLITDPTNPILNDEKVFASEYARIDIESQPKLRSWEYCKILYEGVSPVCEDKSFAVSQILIEAVSKMISLKINQEEPKRDNDNSNIWCKDLSETNRECRHQSRIGDRRRLVQTLTFACEQVYKRESSSTVEELDKLLAKEKWLVFKRLRCHLYTYSLKEQIKPKIRELILDYDNYGDKGYGVERGYEFQKMVRMACEYFGEQLLTKNERQKIFDTILNTPSREEFRKFVERYGEQFKEEDFNNYEKHFHKTKLRPFKVVLFGEYKNYYEKLEKDRPEEITDDTYKNTSGEVYRVIARSPKSIEEFSGLMDKDILDYINNYQDRESIKEDGNLIKIGIEGLAEVFGTLFEEEIIDAPSRVDFWLKNLKSIKHPIYIHSIFQKISEDIREGHFKRSGVWFEFCKKILPEPSEEFSIDYYDDVVDFIEACLSKSELLAINENRESLLSLLLLLCTDVGFKISKDVIPTLTKEGNSTVDWLNAHGRARGRTMTALIKLGHRIRRYDSDANFDFITTTLAKRFDSNPQYPLTTPERVTLAGEYINICILDKEWALKYKSKFFPRDDLELFEKVFSQCLSSHQPCAEIFEIIREELLFSTQHLDKFNTIKDPFDSFQIGGDSTNLIRILGEHLSCYYVIGTYSLKGKESLLEEYYHQIEKIPQRWGELFSYMGWLALRCDKDFEQEFKDYLKWRLEAKNKKLQQKELEYFSPNWFEAECLDIKWRLDTYSKILKIAIPQYPNIQTTILKEILPEHLEKVMECFAKLTNAIKDKTETEYHLYAREDIESILVAGLKSKNQNIRQNAKQACKYLLAIEGNDWILDLMEKYKAC